MGGDRLIRFEEQNYDWLVEKFIKKNLDIWEEFVMDEYENQPEPPDREEPNDETL